MRRDQRPALLALWKYPLDFDHLPVSRLAKVLQFTSSSPDRSNPCSSNPCRHPNAQCQQLMNNESQYICLCRANFRGENCSEEDQQCLQDFCGSRKTTLCQPNSRSFLQGDSAPFCLCPPNRYGQRCEIEHSACLSTPCQNNGSCFPSSQADGVICLCSKEYSGSKCQWKRSSIDFSLSGDVPHRGVVLQFFQIDVLSLQLILLRQQVFLQLPHRLEYYHHDQSPITGIVLAKLYSSEEDLFPSLYLLSLYLNVTSVLGRTQISSINQCEHRQTFSNGNPHFLSSSPRR